MYFQCVGEVQFERRWQKDGVFKQMGCVWRSSKSKLTTKVRAVKSKTDLLSLKPSNIQSVTPWNAWVKNRKTTAFKVVYFCNYKSLEDDLF